MEQEKEQLDLTSLNYVVVEKNKLLEKLRQNRDKHNEVYEASKSGYWLEAREKLTEKESDFKNTVQEAIGQFVNQHNKIGKAIEDQDERNINNFYVKFNFNSVWPLTFPKNHLSDYDKAINMLEFSMADKVKLSSDEFDAYVRNNWAWKDQFVLSNSSFLNKYADNVLACSGMSVATTSLAYNVARQGSKAL